MFSSKIRLLITSKNKFAEETSIDPGVTREKPRL